VFVILTLFNDTFIHFFKNYLSLMSICHTASTECWFLITDSNLTVKSHLNPFLEPTNESSYLLKTTVEVGYIKDFTRIHRPR